MTTRPSTAGKIGISIIIPTHGRSDLVAQLLQSLVVARRQFHGPSEVIVIDSSPNKENGAIQQACAQANSVLHCMPNNVRAKRNWGILHAQYPIVLFVDSDCIAADDLLIEHARMYEEGTSSSLGGVVGLTTFVGEQNWVWKMIERGTTLDAFSYPLHHEQVPWGPTCNISYRREVLEKVGLFDTSFPFALGGDDADLGLRVTDADYRLVTNAHAAVKHERKTWSGVLLIGKRLFRWGRMHVHMMRKHPHRVSITPPTVPGVFILLCLLLIPVSILVRSAGLAAISTLWLLLETIMEPMIVSYGKGRQPAEYFYTLGACLLTLVFQLGTAIEGIRQGDLAPFYRDISYGPPSPRGRPRGMARIWAMILAFPAAILASAVIDLLIARGI